MKSSPDQPQSDQYQFLQDSSHLTRMPSEPRGAGAELKIRDQDNPKKELPPVGSSGPQITMDFKLDFTIRFEDLTFGKLLGQGAYGKVFAGEWKFNPVAIKQYTAQDFSDQTREEIRKEASIMATVSAQSDYLVRLRGVILEKPNYSLVMEYLPGGDLFHLLKSSQEMTWPMRYRIGLDMTIGLHHLHGHGALHRDLKSLNVLLDMNFRAKLADFGLSTLKTSSASTTAGGFKGTVLWSAPELFRRGAKASVASDIYSLGMILWELVSRQIPFADAATSAIAATWVAQGDQEIVPEGTPEDFKALILDCWNKDPAKRPQTDAVAKRLDTLWQSEQKKTVASPTDLSGVPPAPGSPKPVQAGSSDEEMQKLRAEMMRMQLKEAEDERRRVELEKMAEEHARLKVEIEREREIKRQKAELKKSPSAPKPETPASSPPARQPEIKKPLTSEPPVSPPSSVLSQSRYTIAPAPKPLLKPVDAKTLEQLLRFVAEGEQDKAEALIQKDKNLLLHAGTVTDLSGREFKGITAFQYALWALDWHMWTMIKKYLPREEQSQQFAALESKDREHGKHFSLQPLIGALQTYVDNAEKVWDYDQRAEDHWCKVVGGAQKMLPAHAVNEYCRGDRPFEPCPQEWESKLPRTRELNVYDSAQSKWVKGTWFAAPSSKDGLGLNFAFYRYNYAGAGGGGNWRLGVGWGGPGLRGVAVRLLASDLKALQSLWKTRTQQLELLKSELLSAASHSQTLQLDTPSPQPKLSSPEEHSQDSVERLTPPEMKKLSIPSKVEPIIPPSQNIYGLTAPKPESKSVDAKTLGQLLQFVAEGEQDKAEALIQKDQNLLLHTGTVTDLSSREFKGITAFQYALWAMDWHMWKMLQKYLPEEQQREQFEALETKGTAHGKHFSLQPLIGALQTYVENYDSFSWKMFESKREHHWQKVVGGAQRLLPVHVINEYCRPGRSFHPCPEFTEASLPRSRKCGKGDWFTVESNGGMLGQKFGVAKGRVTVMGVAVGWPGGNWVDAEARPLDWDVVALQSLSKTRTQQLELLASQLKMSSSRLGVG